MRSFFGLTTLVVLLPVVFAAPTELKEVQRYAGEVKPGSYIVTLKDGFSPSTIIGTLKGSAKTTLFEVVLPNSFAAEIDEEDLNALRADPNVESIYEDGIATASAPTSQTGAPWGLQRISQNPAVGGDATQLQYTYKYDSSAGAGVDVYVIDTGINVQHVDFGDRARLGAWFGPFTSADDDNGHGTHCAGTVGGTRAGVAKRANLIGVKVLDRNGRGTWANIISGVNWAAMQTTTTRRPSVLSMSLGGPTYPPVDQAVSNAVNMGNHVVVAAGNDHVDARDVSPARAQGVITVGASDINDIIADFSNYGPALDIFAPGVNIFSAWIGSSQASNIISGTSMATPHVAGVIATSISQFGNTSPATMANYLISTRGLKDVVKGDLLGSPNVLLRNEQQ